MDLDLERYHVVDAQRHQWVYLQIVREPGEPPHLHAAARAAEVFA